MSNRGLAELAGHEGIVMSRYRDSVGIWTIGIGHTAAAGGPDPAAERREWALPDLLDLLRRDVAAYEKAVAAAVRVAVSQAEFDALVSFHYNTGAIGYAGLTRALNAGDRAAAANLFMAWKKPAEILPRRRAEQRLFRDGAYSHGGRATVYRATRGGTVSWAAGRPVDVLALIGGADAAAA